MFRPLHCVVALAVGCGSFASVAAAFPTPEPVLEGSRVGEDNSTEPTESRVQRSVDARPTHFDLEMLTFAIDRQMVGDELLELLASDPTDRVSANFQMVEDERTPGMTDVDTDIDIDIESVYQWASAGSRCGLSADLLFAVGSVASVNGRIDGTAFDREATSHPAIFGATGDGSLANLALLLDTDEGAVDGDTMWDRPVGPFQILPASWERYGFDANQDGIADPQNLWDASASAANFLCEMGAGDGGTQAVAIRNYAGSNDLAEQIVDIYSDRVSIDRSSALQREVPLDTPAVGELVVLTPDEFVDLEGIHMVSSASLVEPALSPQEALDADKTTSRVAVDDDGALFLYPFEVNDRAIARGDWDGDGDADIGWFGGGLLIQNDGTLLEDPDGGELAYWGDWDGDGIDSPAIIRTENTASDMIRTRSQIAETVIIPTDGQGIPYGAQIRLTNAEDALPLVGDWNGDGHDSFAIRSRSDDGTDTIEFYDRFGLSELAPVEVDSESVVLVVPNGTELQFGVEEEPAEPVESTTRDEAMVSSVDETGELDLVRVRGIVVASSIADDVEQLLAAAEADGLILQGWGWGSHERQIELRIANCEDPWLTPSHECSPPTATPGHSRHEFGLAIDFHIDGRAISASTEPFEWLTANAHRFGLFNLPSEPWHWSVDGR